MVPISGKLQQEGFELLVGAVDFIDQQHRRRFPADRGQQRPFEQVLFREDLVLDVGGPESTSRLPSCASRWRATGADSSTHKVLPTGQVLRSIAGG
jgi:hypothetical protein